MAAIRWKQIFALIFLILTCAGAQAALKATVDRTQIGENETLTLTLQFDGQTMKDPDLAKLAQDFDVLSNQRQSQLSFGGGNNSSTTNWVVNLMPKRRGDLVIPSFHLAGEVSDAIPIKVTKARAGNDSTQSVYVETDLDHNSAYEGQQVVLTYRLNTAIPLSDLGMAELDIPGTDIVKLSDKQYQKTANGMTYTVVEVKYALFPQKPGALDIPSLRFSAVAPNPNDPFGRGFFAPRGKRLVVNSEARSIQVSPRPDNIPPGNWLPSKGLSLAQRWSRTPQDLVVGEPITRTVIISAQGLQGAQLPPLPEQHSDNFKIYPDQPQIEDKIVSNGVVGTRIESVAIVPTKAGTLTLPAIELSWWDTVSGTTRTSSLEAMTVNVLPPAPVELPVATTDYAEPLSVGQTQQPASENRLVLWGLAVANILLLVICLTLGILLWRRPHNGESAHPTKESANLEEKSAWKQLTRASSQGGKPFREAIIQWARVFWDKPDLSTLAQVVAVSGNSGLEAPLKALDNALYGNKNHQADQGEQALTVMELLRTLRAHGKPQSKPGDGLASLYPE